MSSLPLFPKSIAFFYSIHFHSNAAAALAHNTLAPLTLTCKYFCLLFMTIVFRILLIYGLSPMPGAEQIRVDSLSAAAAAPQLGVRIW